MLRKKFLTIVSRFCFSVKLKKHLSKEVVYGKAVMETVRGEDQEFQYVQIYTIYQQEIWD